MSFSSDRLELQYITLLSWKGALVSQLQHFCLKQNARAAM